MRFNIIFSTYMRNFPIFFIVFSIFIVLIDLYTYRGVKSLISGLKPMLTQAIKIGYWAVPILMLTGLIIWSVYAGDGRDSKRFAQMYWLSGFLILFYVPKLFFIIFNMLQDFGQLLAFLVKKNTAQGSNLNNTAHVISRSTFLLKAGILVAAIPFVSIIYGILKGRFNYTVREVKLSFSNLPEAFDGLRLIQISDLHMGSFHGRKVEVEAAVSLINEQEADLLFFTGDIVNNVADELDGWEETLSKMKAKYGKFSVLGNHDYGKYFKWDNEEQKQKNFQKMLDKHREIGFELLRNQAVELERRGEKIGLVGVENWGLPPFPQLGDLKKAEEKVKDLPFKILLSHDPTHWSEVVTNESNIDLTLSGHTHGMQFGIEIPGFIRWSPVKFKYKHWAGLYEKGKQFLYVNIGLGYIGFPGRVGMPPEITVLELHKTA